MICKHENCSKEATVKCTLTVYEERKFFRWLKEFFHLPTWKDEIENLCADHAADSGYCISCGNFCAGTNDYDFSPISGVCGNCRPEFEEPEPEESDDYDEDFDYEEHFEEDFDNSEGLTYDFKE